MTIRTLFIVLLAIFAGLVTLAFRKAVKAARIAGRFALLLVPRLLLPVSFLIAFILSPIRSIQDIPNWPRRWRDMWDDPI